MALMDPTSAFGPEAWIPRSRITYIDGAIHTEDLSIAHPTDSEGLVTARIYEFNLVKQWLGSV